jgi:hypothetical protein
MNNGFIDSTLTSRAHNLQVEHYRFRDSGSNQGSTFRGKGQLTRLVASAPDQKSNTLILGVKGEGALCARDFLSRGPLDSQGNDKSLTNFKAEKSHYRSLGQNAVDLCLAYGTGNETSSLTNYGPKGNYSAVVGGLNNTTGTTSQYGFVAGGAHNTVNNVYGFIGGGSSHTVSGQYGGIIGGSSSSVNAEAAVVLGGKGGLANTNHSSTYGSCDTANGKRYGALVQLSAYTGSYSGNAEVHMSTHDWAYGGNNGNAYHLTVPNNTLAVITGTVSAVDPLVVNNIKALSFHVVARCSNSTISLMGTPAINILYAPSGTDSWSFNITANNTGYAGIGFKVNSGSSNVCWSLTSQVNFNSWS